MLLAFPLILATACGDPAVNSSFEGKPLTSLAGVVCGGEVKTTPRMPLVGILWKNDVARLSKPGSDASPIMGMTPVRFQLDLFDGAPSEMLTPYKAAGGSVEAEIGFAILFDDVNQDGVYSNAGEPGGDVLLGLAWDRVVLFSKAPDATPAARAELAPYAFMNPEALKEGYQVAEGICDDNGAPTATLNLLDSGSAHIYVLDTPGQIPAEAPKGSCVRFF
jgi:hypothetical protein